MNTQQNELALQELRNRFDGIATDVSLRQVDWRALMESGALATLRVSRYRGTKALGAGDLGLDRSETDQVASIIDLGHRLLLPREILNGFNSVETRARQVLRGYGLDTPLGLFLPAKNYENCALAMASYKVKFGDLVETLIANLESHRSAMTDQYYVLARQVWSRLNGAGLVSVDKWTFEDNFVARCMAQFPSSEELRQAFSFDLRLSFVPLPYEVQREAPDYATATDDLLAMRRQVIEDQRKAREELVNGFVASVQGELYGLCNEVLGDVLTGIENNGVLQGRSVVQLRNLVDKISSLNFWQDKRLDQIQVEIKSLLDRSDARRDSGLDRALISELQTQAQVVLAQVGTVQRGDLDVSTQAPVVALVSAGNGQTPKLTIAKPSVSLKGANSGAKLF